MGLGASSDAAGAAAEPGTDQSVSGKGPTDSSVPSGGLLSRTMLGAAHLAVYKWDLALADVEKVQRQQLDAIVRRSRGTEFGKKHGFSKVRCYEDFRDCVPVGDYDSFSPYIDRMRQGEKNLLVPEFVKYFGNSSGSSNNGKSKFLPITERQIKLQRSSGADALFRYMAWRGAGSASEGFSLGLFPPTTMKDEGPVKITSNPALMIATLPWYARQVYLPDDATMKIPSYDEKLEVIADKYLDHDIRLVSGTTCWFSLLFDKLLEAARKRGREASCVRDLWPNLEVLMGGGVAAGPYVDVIRDRVGGDITLVDTYNATEGGIYAVTDHRDGRGMLMLPHRGTFFEFIPAEELGKPNPTRVPLWEVEKDRLYAVIPTSVSGLFAYTLGDLVRFPSLTPLRIEFAGRTAGCLSTTQELTTHVEVQQAFEEALTSLASGGTSSAPGDIAGTTGPAAVDFTAAADVGVNGSAKARYIVFAEFLPGRAPADRAAFIRAFDASLQRQNRVYREHRSGDTAIVAPELVTMPQGSVRRFMEVIGNVSVQTKFPRILDDERRDQMRRLGGESTFAE